MRTRMAPSPTGEYHVGHLATLLKNYAWAKRHHGQFVLRIEDTDQVRQVVGASDRIMQVIHAYGLDWDEGPDNGGPYAPYVQSQRLALYQQAAHQLVSQDHAYYCFCSARRLEDLRTAQRAAHHQPRYDGHCRGLTLAEAEAKLAMGESHVIRLKVPADQVIEFDDVIRGHISVNSNEVDDQVLLKSDGFPTYHLAVVVDDETMKINYIMRGEEWISSTPKHILLYRAFGWQPPTYAHVPVFLNPDGQGKMSKRKGTVSARSFLDDGYLPEAMLNFFMIFGWAASDQREILTLDDYIREFDPAQISPKSVVFDLTKLAWLNGVYIRQLPRDELKRRLTPFIPGDFPHHSLDAILELVYERMSKLSEFDELTSFFYRPIQIDPVELQKKADRELVLTQLDRTRQALAALTALEWQTDRLELVIRQLQTTQTWKKSQYFMMLRLAVTGRSATPPLFATLAALGREMTLDRLTAASQKLT